MKCWHLAFHHWQCTSMHHSKSRVHSNKCILTLWILSETVATVWAISRISFLIKTGSEKKSRKSINQPTNPRISSHPCGISFCINVQTNSTANFRADHAPLPRQLERVVEWWKENKGKVYIGRLIAVVCCCGFPTVGWCEVVATDLRPGRRCSFYSITVYGYLCSYLCLIMLYIVYCFLVL